MTSGSYDLASFRYNENTSKRTLWIVIALLILAALLFIAGGVMLGIGIHKYNENKNPTAAPASTTPLTPTSLAPTSTTTSSPVEPLSPNGNDIVVLIDSSGDVNGFRSLSLDDSSGFSQQINFIVNLLIPTWPIGNNGVRPAAIFYSAQNITQVGGSQFNFSSSDEFISAIKNTAANLTVAGQPGLAQGFQSAQQLLANTALSKNVTTFAITHSNNITSDTVDAAKNLSTPIVLLSVGNNSIDGPAFNGLNVSIINAQDYSPNIANAVNQAINRASGISPSPTTTTTTTTTTTKTTTAAPTTPQPSTQWPCYSGIVLGLDRSSQNTYASTLNIFILQNLVTSNWNNYQRLGVIGYSSGNYSEASFKSLNTYGNLQNFVTAIPTFNFTSSITAGVQWIHSNFAITGDTQYMNTIIFTSTSSGEDVQTALNDAAWLRLKGALIVVALTPQADPNALLPLVGNDTSKVLILDTVDSSGYTNLAANIIEQFKCPELSTSTVSISPTGTGASPSPSSSLTTPTSTSSTTGLTILSTSLSSSSSSSLATQTVSSEPTTTSVTPPPSQNGTFFPEQSNIVIALDSSTSNIAFAETKSYLTRNFVANWTNIERVGVIGSALHSPEIHTWGSMQSLAVLQSILVSLSEHPEQNSITNAFSEIENNFKDPQYGIQNTVYFTSSSRAADVQGAISSAETLAAGGSLIIVAIQPYADVLTLLPLVDYDASKIIAYWPDNSNQESTVTAQILSQFVSAGQIPTTSMPPVTVCQANIPFAVDISLALTADQFVAEKLFITSQLIIRILPVNWSTQRPFVTYGRSGSLQFAPDTLTLGSSIYNLHQNSDTSSSVAAALGALANAHSALNASYFTNYVVFVAANLTDSASTIQSLLAVLDGKVIATVINPKVDVSPYQAITEWTVIPYADNDDQLAFALRALLQCGPVSGTTVTPPITSPVPTVSTTINTGATSTASIPTSTLPTATTPQTTITPTGSTTLGPVNTCLSNIPFAVDISTSLSSAQFKDEKSLITNQLIPRILPSTWSKPLTFVPYGLNAALQVVSDITALSTAVDNLNQTGGSISKVGQALAGFLNAQLFFDQSYGVNYIVFIGSDLTETVASIQNAINQLNGNVVAVVVNPFVNIAPYQSISGWSVISYGNEDQLASTLRGTLQCGTSSSTTSSTAPTTQPSTVTTIVSTISSSGTTTTGTISTTLPVTTQSTTGVTSTGAPITVCQANIPFAVDNSLSLSTSQFIDEKSLVTNQLISQILPPFWSKPLTFVPYGLSAVLQVVPDIAALNNAITSLNQTGESISKVGQALAGFLNAQLFFDQSYGANYIVLIGSELTEPIASIQNAISQLNGNVVAVIVNPSVNVAQYQSISGWSVIAYGTQDQLAFALRGVLQCGTPVTAITSPSTTLTSQSSTVLSTIQSSPTTVATVTTQTAAVSTFAPTGVPASLCLSNIPFAIDISTSLSASEFGAEKQFITNQLITQILSPSWSKSRPFVTYGLSGQLQVIPDIAALNSAVTNLNQTGGSISKVGQALAAFLNAHFYFDTNYGVNYVVFIGSDLTEPVASIQNAISQLNANVVAVIVNPSVNADSYDQITGWKVIPYTTEIPLVQALRTTLQCGADPGNLATSTIAQPIQTAVTTIAPGATVTPIQQASSQRTTTTALPPTCQANVAFAVDLSLSLSASEFGDQKRLITNQLIPDIGLPTTKPLPYITYALNGDLNAAPDADALSAAISGLQQNTDPISRVNQALSGFLNAGWLFVQSYAQNYVALIGSNLTDTNADIQVNLAQLNGTVIIAIASSTVNTAPYKSISGWTVVEYEYGNQAQLASNILNSLTC